MDAAVLLTLGIFGGGLALDLGSTARRLRTARQQVIETLVQSLRAGTFGPLRMVERYDGLYIVGCGLMHRVDSVEQAEMLVAGALEEVQHMLGGLNLEPLLQTAADSAEEPVPQQPPADAAQESFRDMVEPVVAADVQWQEWTDMPEGPCQEQEVAPDNVEPAVETVSETPVAVTQPAVAASEVRSERKPTPVAIPSPSQPDKPSATTPAATATARHTVRARTRRATRRISITQVDGTLQDIVAHMKSCSTAA